MPLQIKKTKGDRLAAPSEPPPSQHDRSIAPAGDLDPGNRSSRALVAWLIDGSPSVAEQHAAQRAQTESAFAELRRHPIAGRSVMFNLVQILNVPVSTGFADIARFKLPPFLAGESTPIHTALGLAVADCEAVAAKLRALGFERTEGVAVLTTDDFANGGTAPEIDESVRRFIGAAKRLSITPVVVGVGPRLDVAFLKSLTTTIPVLHLEEFRPDILLPFIQKVAVSASMSRRGQDIEIELPPDLKPIE